MVAVPPRLNPVRMCIALIAVVAAVSGYSMLPVEAQSTTSALPFARSFLLTGNYAVVGVDLLPQATDCATFAPDCYAKGNITVDVCPTTGAQPGSCIPAGADVVAAFMYWEAISLDPTTMPPAKLLGQTVTNAKRSDVTLPSEASCLSSGGALKLSMFSADVLRFFPLQKDLNQQSTGRRIVTGTHQVALPEVGNGNQARQGAGASIFFVYRTASDALRKIVVYDGAYLQTPAGTVTRQTLQGFYQSATVPQPSAWLTHIVGSGAKNETERIKFNGTANADVVATDPFPFPLGNQGGNGSDRAWSNPTYDVSSKMQQASSPVSGFGETATTEVDHTNNTPYECLSWAAVIFSTAVKDVDADGLPDGLEDATSTLKDPYPGDPANNQVGTDLPRLNAMGASSSHKDVFIEMNGMWTPGASYGAAEAPFSTILDIDTVTDSAGHNHLPTPAVIKLLGDALINAPTPIALHVDVGDTGDYKALGPDYKVNIADAYLVPTAEARGGELIRETACLSNLQTENPTQPNSIGCHFPKFPGTVGWKFGFQHYRDQAVNGEDGLELNATQEAECYVDGSYGNGQGTACRRRFDPIRADLFHYFLYAHAMGIPKGNPCLNTSGVDVPYPVSGTASCGSLTNNPDFHVPKSFSGVADFPGGGALITLGLWDMTKFVGSTFLQASTTLHELGHNWELSHAGKPPVFGNATTATGYEANCKPNYPSIMSYLFQVNGLLDLAGNPHIDYSRKAYYDLANGTTNQVLNESALYDGNQAGTSGLPLPDVSLAAAFRYRTAWFVPITTGSVAEAIGIQPSGRFCGGEAFGTTAPAPNPPMGRFDGPSLASAIDWKLDGLSSPSSSDANLDGAITAAYAGYNDWSNVRLDRVGGSKNPEGYSLGQGGFGYGQGGFGFGPGNFDFGQGGFGFGQGGFGFGQGGFGFGTGGFQLGDGAFGFGQGGFGFGQGGFGFGQGGFGFGQGGFGFGSDPDFDHTKKMGNLPPLSAAVCVIGGTNTTTPAVNCPTGTQGPLHRNRVTWAPPNAGKPVSYRVYRALGSSINGSSVVEQLCGITDMPACPSGTFFVDNEELPNGQDFTYFVRGVLNSCDPATSPQPCLPDDCNPTLETCLSGPSNFVTLPAENTPPVAVNDPSQGVTYATNPNSTLIIPAPGVLGPLNQNDSDVDSPKARIRVLDFTQPSSGSVVVSADGSFTYTSTNQNPGTVTFTYRADDGFWRKTNILMSNPSNSATVTITFGGSKKK